MLLLASGALGRGPARSGPSAGTSSAESSLGPPCHLGLCFGPLVVRVLAPGRRAFPFLHPVGAFLNPLASSLFSSCHCSPEDIGTSPGCGSRQAACALSPDHAHPPPQHRSPVWAPGAQGLWSQTRPQSHAGSLCGCSSVEHDCARGKGPSS